VARALVAALIGTVQVDFVPWHAPVHVRSLQPRAGVATSRTGEYDRKAAEHLGRQAIPAELLLTMPFPATATVSRKEAGANRAVTVFPGVTESTQSAAPVHPPDQRTRRDPGPGVPVSVRRCPEFHVVVQVASQMRPGTSAVTLPGPDTLTVSGVCESSLTSQDESCVSTQPPECP
jgi:hypothetical protein